jgi:hypothetical protein
MTDTQKIEAIKRILESTDLSSLENLESATSDIWNIVYGI